MRLRPATERDAEAVAACVCAAYRRYVRRIGRRPRPMREDYRRLVRNSNVTVAEQGGRIVGVLVVGPTRRGFLLENVAVDPAEQGRGVGRILLRRAEEQARQAGYRSIYLYTHAKMSENRSLYEGRGYVAFRRCTEQGYPRIYMRKRLP